MGTWHALAIAITQLGVREATGRNDGIPAKRYMRGDQLAWCMGLQLYCFDKADSPDLWDVSLGPDAGSDSDYWKLRSCETAWQYLHDREVTIQRLVVPSPQDLVFFYERMDSDPTQPSHRRRISHVGMVEWSEPVPGQHVQGHQIHKLHTIEGNVGDRVDRRVRQWPDRRIAGFARICPTPEAFLIRQESLRRARGVA